VLSEYIKFSPAKIATPTKRLFVNVSGPHSRRLREDNQVLSGQTKIEKTITPHTLRKSLPPIFLENGPTASIQEMLATPTSVRRRYIRSW
jgi:site-specific recombinase XerD